MMRTSPGRRGSPLDELRVRHHLDTDLAVLSASIEELPENAGMWLSWSPLRITVATTDPTSMRVKNAITQFIRPDLVNVVTAPTSLAALERGMKALLRERDRGTTPAFDATIDLKQNGLRIVTDQATTTAQAKVRELAHQLPEVAPLKVSIASGQLAKPTTFGGGSLGNGCSSAFIIRNSSSGYFGPLSAGHSGCNTSTTYLSGNIPTQIINPVAYGYRDSSLQRLLGGAPSNEIYISVSPYYRSITSSISWSALMPGDTICKQTRTTGYDCGLVGNKNFSPSYIPNGGRFVQVDTTCEPGDSGGSWFKYNSAVGVQSGRANNFGHVTCLFGSISYAIPSGYYVVTS